MYNDQPMRSDAERRDAQAWGRRADIMMGVAGGLAMGTLVIGILTDWDGDDDEDDGGDGVGDAGATGPAPEADVVPQRGGAVLMLGWRR